MAGRITENEINGNDPGEAAILDTLEKQQYDNITGDRESLPGDESYTPPPDDTGGSGDVTGDQESFSGDESYSPPPDEPSYNDSYGPQEGEYSGETMPGSVDDVPDYGNGLPEDGDREIIQSDESYREPVTQDTPDYGNGLPEYDNTPITGSGLQEGEYSGETTAGSAPDYGKDLPEYSDTPMATYQRDDERLDEQGLLQEPYVPTSRIQITRDEGETQGDRQWEVDPYGNWRQYSGADYRRQSVIEYDEPPTVTYRSDQRGLQRDEYGQSTGTDYTVDQPGGYKVVGTAYADPAARDFTTQMEEQGVDITNPWFTDPEGMRGQFEGDVDLLKQWYQTGVKPEGFRTIDTAGMKSPDQARQALMDEDEAVRSGYKLASDPATRQEALNSSYGKGTAQNFAVTTETVGQMADRDEWLRARSEQKEYQYYRQEEDYTAGSDFQRTMQQAWNEEQAREVRRAGADGRFDRSWDENANLVAARSFADDRNTLREAAMYYLSGGMRGRDLNAPDSPYRGLSGKEQSIVMGFATALSNDRTEAKEQWAKAWTESRRVGGQMPSSIRNTGWRGLATDVAELFQPLGIATQSAAQQVDDLERRARQMPGMDRAMNALERAATFGMTDPERLREATRNYIAYDTGQPLDQIPRPGLGTSLFTAIGMFGTEATNWLQGQLFADSSGKRQLSLNPADAMLRGRQWGQQNPEASFFIRMAVEALMEAGALKFASPLASRFSPGEAEIPRSNRLVAQPGRRTVNPLALTEAAPTAPEVLVPPARRSPAPPPDQIVVRGMGKPTMGSGQSVRGAAQEAGGLPIRRPLSLTPEDRAALARNLKVDEARTPEVPPARQDVPARQGTPAPWEAPVRDSSPGRQQIPVRRITEERPFELPSRREEDVTPPLQRPAPAPEPAQRSPIITYEQAGVRIDRTETPLTGVPGKPRIEDAVANLGPLLDTERAAAERLASLVVRDGPPRDVRLAAQELARAPRGGELLRGLQEQLRPYEEIRFRQMATLKNQIPDRLPGLPDPSLRTGTGEGAKFQRPFVPRDPQAALGERTANARREALFERQGKQPFAPMSREEASTAAYGRARTLLDRVLPTEATPGERRWTGARNEADYEALTTGEPPILENPHYSQRFRELKPEEGETFQADFQVLLDSIPERQQNFARPIVKALEENDTASIDKYASGFLAERGRPRLERQQLLRDIYDLADLYGVGTDDLRGRLGAAAWTEFRGSDDLLTATLDQLRARDEYFANKRLLEYVDERTQFPDATSPEHIDNWPMTPEREQYRRQAEAILRGPAPERKSPLRQRQRGTDPDPRGVQNEGPTGEQLYRTEDSDVPTSIGSRQPREGPGDPVYSERPLQFDDTGDAALDEAATVERYKQRIERVGEQRKELRRQLRQKGSDFTLELKDGRRVSALKLEREAERELVRLMDRVTNSPSQERVYRDFGDRLEEILGPDYQHTSPEELGDALTRTTAKVEGLQRQLGQERYGPNKLTFQEAVDRLEQLGVWMLRTNNWAENSGIGLADERIRELAGYKVDALPNGDRDIRLVSGQIYKNVETAKLLQHELRGATPERKAVVRQQLRDLADEKQKLQDERRFWAGKYPYDKEPGVKRELLAERRQLIDEVRGEWSNKTGQYDSAWGRLEDAKRDANALYSRVQSYDRAEPALREWQTLDGRMQLPPAGLAIERAAGSFVEPDELGVRGVESDSPYAASLSYTPETMGIADALPIKSADADLPFDQFVSRIENPLDRTEWLPAPDAVVRDRNWRERAQVDRVRQEADAVEQARIDAEYAADMSRGGLGGERRVRDEGVVTPGYKEYAQLRATERQIAQIERDIEEYYLASRSNKPIEGNIQTTNDARAARRLQEALQDDLVARAHVLDLTLEDDGRGHTLDMLQEVYDGRQRPPSSPLGGAERIDYQQELSDYRPYKADIPESMRADKALAEREQLVAEQRFLKEDDMQVSEATNRWMKKEIAPGWLKGSTEVPSPLIRTDAGAGALVERLRKSQALGGLAITPGSVALNGGDIFATLAQIDDDTEEGAGLRTALAITGGVLGSLGIGALLRRRGKGIRAREASIAGKTETYWKGKTTDLPGIGEGKSWLGTNDGKRHEASRIISSTIAESLSQSVDNPWALSKSDVLMIQDALREMPRMREVPPGWKDVLEAEQTFNFLQTQGQKIGNILASRFRTFEPTTLTDVEQGLYSSLDFYMQQNPVLDGKPLTKTPFNPLRETNQVVKRIVAPILLTFQPAFQISNFVSGFTLSRPLARLLDMAGLERQYGGKVFEQARKNAGSGVRYPASVERSATVTQATSAPLGKYNPLSWPARLADQADVFNKKAIYRDAFSSYVVSFMRQQMGEFTDRSGALFSDHFAGIPERLTGLPDDVKGSLRRVIDLNEVRTAVRDLPPADRQMVMDVMREGQQRANLLAESAANNQMRDYRNRTKVDELADSFTLFSYWSLRNAAQMGRLAVRRPEALPSIAAGAYAWSQQNEDLPGWLKPSIALPLDTIAGMLPEEQQRDLNAWVKDTYGENPRLRFYPWQMLNATGGQLVNLASLVGKEEADALGKSFQNSTAFFDTVKQVGLNISPVFQLSGDLFRKAMGQPLTVGDWKMNPEQYRNPSYLGKTGMMARYVATKQGLDVIPRTVNRWLYGKEQDSSEETAILRYMADQQRLGKLTEAQITAAKRDKLNDPTWQAASEAVQGMRSRQAMVNSSGLPVVVQDTEYSRQRAKLQGDYRAAKKAGDRDAANKVYKDYPWLSATQSYSAADEQRKTLFAEYERRKADDPAAAREWLKSTPGGQTVQTYMNSGKNKLELQDEAARRREIDGYFALPNPGQFDKKSPEYQQAWDARNAYLAENPQAKAMMERSRLEKESQYEQTDWQRQERLDRQRAFFKTVDEQGFTAAKEEAQQNGTWADIEGYWRRDETEAQYQERLARERVARGREAFYALPDPNDTLDLNERDRRRWAREGVLASDTDLAANMERSRQRRDPRDEREREELDMARLTFERIKREEGDQAAAEFLKSTKAGQRLQASFDANDSPEETLEKQKRKDYFEGVPYNTRVALGLPEDRSKWSEEQVYAYARQLKKDQKQYLADNPSVVAFLNRDPLDSLQATSPESRIRAIKDRLPDPGEEGISGAERTRRSNAIKAAERETPGVEYYLGQEAKKRGEPPPDLSPTEIKRNALVIEALGEPPDRSDEVAWYAYWKEAARRFPKEGASSTSGNGKRYGGTPYTTSRSQAKPSTNSTVRRPYTRTTAFNVNQPVPRRSSSSRTPTPIRAPWSARGPSTTNMFPGTSRTSTRRPWSSIVQYGVSDGSPRSRMSPGPSGSVTFSQPSFLPRTPIVQSPTSLRLTGSRSSNFGASSSRPTPRPSSGQPSGNGSPSPTIVKSYLRNQDYPSIVRYLDDYRETTAAHAYANQAIRSLEPHLLTAIKQHKAPTRAQGAQERRNFQKRVQGAGTGLKGLQALLDVRKQLEKHRV